MVELPTISIEIEKDGKKSLKWLIDTSSAEVARLFNQQWLSRYPRAKYINYNNGSKFKFYFEARGDLLKVMAT